MTTTTEIMPLVSLAAANHMNKVGYWTEFNEMVDRAIQVVPNPRSIEATLDNAADGTEPIILIFIDYHPEARHGPSEANESPERRWERWAAEKYSGEILRHFSMMAMPLQPEDSDENGR